VLANPNKRKQNQYKFHLKHVEAVKSQSTVFTITTRNGKKHNGSEPTQWLVETTQNRMHHCHWWVVCSSRVSTPVSLLASKNLTTNVYESVVQSEWIH